MPRSYKIILGILALLIGLSIYMEARQPAPIDWTPTYSVRDKIPMGTYVFYHSLKDKAKTFKPVDRPPYEFLQDSVDQGTYFFVNRELEFNDPELKALLAWVRQGNTVFLSAQYSNLFDSDTLNLKWHEKIRPGRGTPRGKFNFTNPDLAADSSYAINLHGTPGYFKKIDSARQKVLGTARFALDSAEASPQEINFLEAPYGDGRFLLHTTPQVFTNHFMLSADNFEYAEKLLAYMDLDAPLYFDTYHDAGERIPASPLYVVLGNKYLKWGYYFLLIGAVLFIIFKGKRKQKAIQVIPPLKNKSYEYVRMISGLYLDDQAHTAIAHKKINQFLQDVREKFGVDAQNIDDALINRLKEQTGKRKKSLETLFDQIKNLQKRQDISKEELKSLTQNINQFKANS